MSSNDQNNPQQSTPGVAVNNGNVVVGGCRRCGANDWQGGMSITWDANGRRVASAPTCGGCGHPAGS